MVLKKDRDPSILVEEGKRIGLRRCMKLLICCINGLFYK